MRIPPGLLVRLGDDLVGPPMYVEVIDIGRAKVDLERLEYAGSRHAQDLRAHPIDVGIYPWRLGVEQGEYTGQAFGFVGRLDQVQAANKTEGLAGVFTLFNTRSD